MPPLVFLAFGWLAFEVPSWDIPVSPTVFSYDGKLLEVRLASDGRWVLPVRLNQMGHYLPKVAVSAEDKRFFSHLGVDPLALARALAQNMSHFKVISGASTITVQTIRLLNPAPRTLWSKYREFVQALKLERILSKEKILELYLNLAPFGGNLRGAGAASWAYFQKKPSDLTLAESALLVAVLRGPSWYRPDRWPKRAENRRNLILSRLLSRSIINLQAYNRALTEPVKPKRYDFPALVPRLADRVLRESDHSWNWNGPGFMGLISSIDSQVQKNLETRLGQALADLPVEISGAGAVLDNESGRVLAYVGNARPEGPAGFVDCVLALRSPGSTLKPFVYLAAFSEGLITPSTLLADTPLGLEGQAPRNFDLSYRVEVSVKTALSQSLNVPAVRVLRLVGEKKARETLAKVGISFDPQVTYGDSLILGGVETSLERLLTAYAVLARQGRFINLSLNPSHREPPSKLSPEGEVFSPGAVWLVNHCLVDDTRLEPFLRGDNLAIKSGTSHGFRDAWLALYNPSFTAILWLGDPSGHSREKISGLKALAEPGVALMRSLGASKSWPPPPAEVSSYRACPLTGAPAGPFCPSSALAFRLTLAAKPHPCRLHVLREGRLSEFWPDEFKGFVSQRESNLGPYSKVSIVSPGPNSIFVLYSKASAAPLKAEGTMGPVYWFVDGEFFQAAGPERIVFLPLTLGRHSITLVDSQNNMAKSVFTVIEPKRGADIPIIRPSAARPPSSP
ncbi:MAG: penicillin-binding protein 1C [Deltaproteobacteria bacterium]|nr:penicillin-binding protein 1C [Deltaproteobacteria bacterium]